eukprot:CAMPEP_0196782964 /NCGR_PEP_ID=MMETSP1104-20130614/12267_1 /TAXON_ID=33652 /ORGANISM="Cafeteria sp., Strain Caron Lab Isolate" /LENGTH=497 /DNA_ID=CAMNT_0042153213 /DNA_START=58 /DNA_END=1551 /DNA_ORIENTATION=-
MSTIAARKELFINGRWTKPALRGLLRVINPATERVLAEVGVATQADVDQAVRAASASFPAWSSMPGFQRAGFLRKIAHLVRDRREELSRVETLNSGKPLPESEWDVDDAAGCFDYYADMAERFESTRESSVAVPDESFTGRVRLEPMGVVAAIVPFNYPMLMATWITAPALAAGCTVVLKPSELTPLTALLLAEIAHDAGLPEGVFNVLPGDGPTTGAPLVEHPLVDKISFTGSVPTGVNITKSAAKDVKNVTLELGGKSPAIVFSDVDLDKAVEWVMFGAFWTNGQICSATSRLLVDEAIAPEFLERLVREVGAIKAGDPMAEGTKLGPVISKKQYDKVMGYVESARAEGATILTGGGRPHGVDAGFFVAPTVITDVASTMKVWREEIFGPVLSVRTFKSEEQAIAEANDTDYGLGAAVFTSDPDRMRRVVNSLRAGIVWENCSQPCFSQLPWGGFKKSGTGRGLGEWGFKSYLEVKQVVTNVGTEPLGWYPRAKL